MNHGKPSLHKRGLKAFALQLLFILVISGSILFTSVSALANQSSVSTLHDIQGHWAENQINQGITSGWMSGYPDGSFKPDQSITRAEFVSLINRAAGYKETGKTSFSDVGSRDWFAADLARAITAGYISGYSDKSFKPNKSINRQEVAVVLARVAKLETAVDPSAQLSYKDAAELGSWSAKSVAAVSGRNLMAGYPDRCFRPSQAMTRAEALVCLSKVFIGQPVKPATSTFFNKAGVYGPSSGNQMLECNVNIESAGVILQNTTIKGDLLLAEAIGDGEATLKNVTVTGNTVIKGGGSHSIVIENSTLPILTVEKESVRIVASGKTSVNMVQLNAGAALVEASISGQGFETVTLNQTIPASAKVTLTGDFSLITMQAPATLNIISGTVSNLEVASSAQKSNITIAKEAGVKALTLNAPITVSGQGSITTANINVSGSSIAQTPANVKFGAGVTGNIAGTVTGISTSGTTVGTGGGTGGGDGNNPLNLVSSDPANAATGVSANTTIKLIFDRGVVRDYWTNNQGCVTMSTNAGTPVAISVTRIADNDDEKRNIYVTPNSALTAGETFKVMISSGLKANNGNILGTERTVTFTVAGQTGGDGGGGGSSTGTLTISDGDGRSSLNAKAPNGPADGAQTNQNVMSFKLSANAIENIKIATGDNMTLAVSNINGLVKTDLANIKLFTDPNGDGSPADGSAIADGTMSDIASNTATITFNLSAAQTINAGSYMNYIVQLNTTANWGDNDRFSFAANSIGITAVGLTSSRAVNVSGTIQARAFNNANSVGTLTLANGDGRSSLNAKAPYGPADGAKSNQNIMTFKLSANAVENIVIATGNSITVAVSNISGLSDGDLFNLELYTDNTPADGSPNTKVANGSMSAIAGNSALITYNLTSAQIINASSFMNYIIQLDTTANWGNNDTFTLAANSVSIVAASGTASNENVGVTGTVSERAFVNPEVMPSISASNTDGSALGLTETTLNGAVIKITLVNDTYKSSLAAGDLCLNNSPSGLSIGNVERKSSTEAWATLLFDGTDFDADIINFSLKVKNTGLTDSPSGLNSPATIITAVVEP